MHSKAAAQVINCWQTAADPKATFNKRDSNVRFLKMIRQNISFPIGGAELAAAITA